LSQQTGTGIVSSPFALMMACAGAAEEATMTMGGFQVPGQGSGDDGYDEDGYDESQRAEILEVTRLGPSDGTIQTDLDPDIEDEAEDEDNLEDIEMTDDELGEEDDDPRETEEDMAEDDIQDEFDDDSFVDDDLDDPDDDALNP
jgi:hypothetical protein